LTAAPLWGRLSDQARDPRKPLQIAFIASAGVYLLVSQQHAFVWLAALIGINGLLVAGIEPMSDSLALNLVKDRPKTGFGSIRLWGSLGWAVVVLLAGWVIEQTSIISIFIGYSVLMVASVFVVGFLNLGERQPEKDSCPKGKPTGSRSILGMIRLDRGLVGLALTIGIVGFTRLGIYQFQAIYLDQLGARESLIGLASTLSAIVELPGMLWADHLVRKYGSHRVIGFTMLIYAITGSFVVLYPSVETIMAASGLSGIGFSFYSVGIAVFLSERAPMGQTATTLALFMTTLRGLISMIAAPLAGIIFDAAGAYWLFVLAVGGSLLAGLVFRLMVTGKRSRVDSTGNELTIQ
jgi:PPP family 3-phenylpropionic acid transporter